MLLKELFEATTDAYSTVRNVFRSNFARRGFSIEFPGHTKTRSTEGERGAEVDGRRLMEALDKILKLHDDNDPRLMGLLEVAKRRPQGVQVVFIYRYGDTAINIPCVIEPDPTRHRLKFVIKTVMTKPDFKQHSSHDIVFNLV